MVFCRAGSVFPRNNLVPAILEHDRNKYSLFVLLHHRGRRSVMEPVRPCANADARPVHRRGKPWEGRQHCSATSPNGAPGVWDAKPSRRLYPVLIRRYGKGERYTAGQIERALEISRLGHRYRPYAYAIFTSPAAVMKLAPDLREKVVPMTGQNGLAAALQFYALSYAQSLGQTADASNDWWSVGGADGGVGDGGGDGGGGGDG